MAACSSSMVASSTRKRVSCGRMASFIVKPFSFWSYRSPVCLNPSPKGRVDAAAKQGGRVGSLRRRQRHAEQGAPLEPGARTIARIAVEAMHPFQDGKHARRAEVIAQAQR